MYSQIYTKFSTVADILASIGIGAMFMCIISLLVIALSLWFENEEKVMEETEANPADIVVQVILETYLSYILKILITIQWMIYTGMNSRLLYKWVSISNSFQVHNIKKILHCRKGTAHHNLHLGEAPGLHFHAPKS